MTFPLAEDYRQMINRLKIEFPRLCNHPDFFDFSVQEGWQPIIIETMKLLEASGDDIRVCQVKQKFGSLRFYYDGAASADCLRLINEMQRRCDTSCETCGRPGSLRQRGFVYVACDECNER